MNNHNASVLMKGLKDGIPIALGYFTVAFSLGIVARNAGLTPFQGFVASQFTAASAGEFAVFQLIIAGTTCLGVMLISLITNARYLLMSCALSQRVPENLNIFHRMLLSLTITDEIFGITIAQPGMINPFYSYGAYLIAAPSWAAGTSVGIIAGNLLPARLVTALGVALYGMFISTLVPAAKKQRLIAGLIAISFVVSYLLSICPMIRELSDGTRVIISTIILSSGAAILFPVKNLEEV